jgi:3-oxoadipate enol-lactonase
VGTVDTTARLGAIAAPTLVIAGELDQGTPVAMAQQLAPTFLAHGSTCWPFAPPT